MRPEIMAGPIWRAFRLEKVRALMGSSLPLPPRPPAGGSSWARAITEQHNRSGNSLICRSISHARGRCVRGGGDSQAKQYSPRRRGVTEKGKVKRKTRAHGGGGGHGAMKFSGTSVLVDSVQQNRRRRAKIPAVSS